MNKWTTLLSLTVALQVGIITPMSLMRIFNTCSTYHTDNTEIACLFRKLIKIDLLIKDLIWYVKKVILNASSVISCQKLGILPSNKSLDCPISYWTIIQKPLYGKHSLNSSHITNSLCEVLRTEWKKLTTFNPKYDSMLSNELSSSHQSHMNYPWTLASVILSIKSCKKISKSALSF